MIQDSLAGWIQWEKGAKQYLCDAKLTHTEFPFHNDVHDHCELCWARFGNSPDDLKAGYFDRTNSCWICENCYWIFRDIFNWSSDEEISNSV